MPLWRIPPVSLRCITHSFSVQRCRIRTALLTGLTPPEKAKPMRPVSQRPTAETEIFDIDLSGCSIDSTLSGRGNRDVFCDLHTPKNKPGEFNAEAKSGSINALLDNRFAFHMPADSCTGGDVAVCKFFEGRRAFGPSLPRLCGRARSIQSTELARSPARISQTSICRKIRRQHTGRRGV